MFSLHHGGMPVTQLHLDETWEKKGKPDFLVVQNPLPCTWTYLQNMKHIYRQIARLALVMKASHRTLVIQKHILQKTASAIHYVMYNMIQDLSFILADMELRSLNLPTTMQKLQFCNKHYSPLKNPRVKQITCHLTSGLGYSNKPGHHAALQQVPKAPEVKKQPWWWVADILIYGWLVYSE